MCQLRDFLEEAGLSKAKLKDDPREPMPLVEVKVFDQLHDREQSMHSVITAFAQRAAFHSGDREFNPIVAIAAGPGAGKSRFIDELMDKVSGINEEAGVGTPSPLPNCIPIPVTFNSFGSFTISEAERGGKYAIVRALNHRMLYSHLCKRRDVTYPAFLRCLDRVISDHPAFHEAFLAELPLLVEAIGASKERPVVLAVDELVRAEELGDPLILLRQIGATLDGCPHFHALATSLDAHLVGKVRTGAGRPVTWIPLPPLSFTSSIEAMQEHHLRFRVNTVGPGEKAVPPKIADRDLRDCPTVLAVIADCNGHPRSLERVLRLLLNYHIPGKELNGHTTTTLANAVGSPHAPLPPPQLGKTAMAQATLQQTLPPYTELISDLVTSLGSIYVDELKECPDLTELVAPALLSKKVYLSDSPHSKRAPGDKAPRTYESYVRAGIYLNSKQEDAAIPVLSPIVLRLMCRVSPEWELAEPLQAMLELDGHAEPEELNHH